MIVLKLKNTMGYVGFVQKVHEVVLKTRSPSFDILCCGRLGKCIFSYKVLDSDGVVEYTKV